MTKILIVEDDLPLRMAYDVILKREGYTIMRAKDGKEGLEKAEEFKPDLILLDLLMPTVDGLTFLEKYDVVKKHPDVKVIVFSNLNHADQIERAEKLGANRYIVKSSVSPSQLAGIINETVEVK